MAARWFKTILVIIVFAVILVPIAINCLCLTVFPAPLVGDGKLWLVFWGSYLGGIIAVLSTIYVLYRNHRMEYNRKEYEIQKEYFNSLCVDMGKLCSIIDMNLLCFYLKNLTNLDNANNIIHTLSTLNQSIICEYNEFCLKYAHWRGEEGKVLINTYAVYSNLINRQMLIIQEGVNDRLNGRIRPEVFMSMIEDTHQELKKLGDVRPELFSLAEKWKKREYNVTEEKRNKYKDE